MKANLIAPGAVDAALRKADVSLEETAAIILEADGSISITK